MKKIINAIICCDDNIEREFEAMVEYEQVSYIDKQDADGNRGIMKTRCEINDIKIIKCSDKNWKPKTKNEQEIIENKILSRFN